MPAKFVLTAQINVAAPQNLRETASKIKRQLESVNISIPIRITKKSLDIVRQLNTQVNKIRSSLEAAAATSQKVNKSIMSIGTTTRRAMADAEKDIKRVTTGVQAVGRNTAVATTEIAEFGRQAALAFRRFMAFSIPAGVMLGVVVSLKKGVSAAVDFERQLLRVRQVTGTTEYGIRSLQRTIGELSKGLGVSSEELAKVSLTFAQSGMSLREVKEALKAVAETSLAPTFDNMSSSAEGAIAAMHQFNIKAEDMRSVMGSINAIAANFAVESGDLIEAIRRAGGAFKIAGASVNELLAAFTAVRSTTRELPAPIATGLRTILTRLRRPRTIEFLKRLGIQLQDTQGRFIGVVPAIRALHEALSKLNPRDVRYAQIVEQIAGFRQITRVIPLIQRIDVLEQALAVAQAGTASTAKDAAVAQSNLAVQLTKTKETWLDLMRSVEKSNVFKNMTVGAIDLSNAMVNLLKSLGPIVPILGALGTIKIANVTKEFVGGFAAGITGFAKATQINTTATVQNTEALNRVAAALAGEPIGATGRFVNITTNEKQPVGRMVGVGAARNIMLLSMLQLSVHAFGNLNNKLVKAVDTVTKFIIAMEAVRLGIGMLSGLNMGWLQNIRGAVGGFGAFMGPRLSPFLPEQTASTAVGWLPIGPVGAPHGYYRGRLPATALGKMGRMARIGWGLRGGGWNIGAYGGLGYIRQYGAYVGVAGASTAGVMYGSKLISEALKKAADSANYTAEQLGKLSAQYKMGRIAKYAGIGTSVGFAAGMMVPLPGAGLVGAGVGAGVGALIAALSDNTKEIKKLNRESRFTKATEILSQKLTELLSGRSKITGLDFSSFGEQLKKANQTIIESYISGDIAQAKQREAVVAKQLASFINLKTAIIKVVSSLQEFEVAGHGAGRILIQTMAQIRGVRYEKVAKEIEEEIKQRVNLQHILEREEAAFRAFGDSLRVLKTFNAALYESTEASKAFYSALGTYKSVAGGGVGNVSFVGAAGNLKFTQALSGKIFSNAAYNTALQQTFMGLPKQLKGQFMQEITSVLKLMTELPQILRESAPNVPLGSEYLLKIMNEKLGKYKTGGVVDRLVEGILSGLERKMQSRESGGPGVVLGLMRNTPQEFAKSLLGREAANYVNELTEAVRQINSKLNKYLDIVNQEVQIQNKILDAQVNVLNLELERKKTIFELKKPGQNYGVQQALQDFVSRQSFILQNTGVAGNAGPLAIGNRLSNVNQRIFKLSQSLQQAKTPEEFSRISSSLKNLREESHRLTTALQNYRNITEQTSVIMAEINRLENERKTKFSLIERYAVGDVKERQQILRTILAAIQLSRGKINLEQLSPDLRKNVMQLFKDFWNIKTAAFGGKTGAQMWPGIVFGSIGIGHTVPKSIQQAFGFTTVGGAAKVLAQPEQRSKAEQQLISMLDSIYKARETAELQLIKQQQEFVKSLQNLAPDIKKIGDEIASALLESRITGVKAKISVAEEEQAALRQRIEKRQAGLRGVFGIVGETRALSPELEKTYSDIIAKIKDKSSEIAKIQEEMGVTATSLIKPGTLGGFFGKQNIITRKEMRGKLSDYFTNIIAPNIRSMVDPAKLKELQDNFINSIIGQMNFRSNGHLGSIPSNDNIYTSKIRLNRLMQFGALGVAQYINRRALERRNKLIQDILPEGKRIPQYEHIVNMMLGHLEDILKYAQDIGDTSLKDLNDELSTLHINLKQLYDEISRLNNVLQQRGGTVTMASGGVLRKRGTDTVPAMLTPGEFVVNREATRKHIGLLKAINSGANVTISNGVMYAQGGGIVPDLNTYIQQLQPIKNQLLKFAPKIERQDKQIFLQSIDVSLSELQSSEARRMFTDIDQHSLAVMTTPAYSNLVNSVIRREAEYRFKTARRNALPQNEPIMPSALPIPVRQKTVVGGALLARPKAITSGTPKTQQANVVRPPRVEDLLSLSLQQLQQNYASAITIKQKIQQLKSSGSSNSITTTQAALGIPKGTPVDEQWINRYIANLITARSIVSGPTKQQQLDKLNKWTQENIQSLTPYQQRLSENKNRYEQYMAYKRKKYQQMQEQNMAKYLAMRNAWRQGMRVRRSGHRLTDAEREKRLQQAKRISRSRADAIARQQELKWGQSYASMSPVDTGRYNVQPGSIVIGSPQKPESYYVLPPGTTSEKKPFGTVYYTPDGNFVMLSHDGSIIGSGKTLGGYKPKQHITQQRNASQISPNKYKPIASMASRGAVGVGLTRLGTTKPIYGSRYKFSEAEQQQILGEQYPQYGKTHNELMQRWRNLRKKREELRNKINNAGGNDLAQLLSQQERITEEINRTWSQIVSIGGEYVSPGLAASERQRLTRNKMIREGRMAGSVVEPSQGDVSKLKGIGQDIGIYQAGADIARKLQYFERYGKIFGNHVFANIVYPGYETGRDITGVMLSNFAQNLRNKLMSNSFTNDELKKYVLVYEKLKSANLDKLSQSWANLLKLQGGGITVPKLPILHLHSGGFVKGTGDVPAILEGGEFVIPKQAFQGGGIVQPHPGTTVSKMSIAGLDLFSTSVDKLENNFNVFNGAVEKLGGLVQQIKDAFAQEVNINVTHAPIQVIVDGEVAIEKNEQTIADIAWKAIAPELDRMKERLREFGPGLS